MNKPKQRGSRRVLTKAELKALLDVPTTVKDARMILERNKKALQFLRVRDKCGRFQWVEVGCPHCINADPSSSHYACGKCAFNDKSTRAHHAPCSMACLRYTFGGLDIDDLVERPDWYFAIVLSKFSLDIARPKNRRLVGKMERFLRGHIEWAREVIRRGGTGEACLRADASEAGGTQG